MTRTSKALKRFGIAGLAVATIGAGAPALIATAAQASTTPTTIAISPATQSGVAGTCLNYTVSATDAAGASAGATVTVTLTPSAVATPAQDVDFCTATDGTTTPSPTTPSNVTNGGAGANDQGSFVTDAQGQVSFGVISNQAGTVNIQAFYDTNGNGSFNAGEPQSQSTAVFGGGGAPGSNAQADQVRCVDATPESATNVVGETHTFQARLTNNGTATVPGAVVPNSGTAACTGAVVPGVTPVFTVTSTTGATTLGPVACGQSDNTGVATCSYTRSAVGSDTILVYVNQSTGATAGQDATEPGDTITKNWIAAQTGNTVAVTCEANGGTVNGVTDPSNTGASTGTGSSCTQQNTDGSRIFTATVKNTAATPVVQPNILVRFTVTGDATPKTFDCTTGANGQCSVLITDATPVSGEVNTVTAVIRGTTSSGSATLTFSNVVTDARNVSLTPKTQTVTPGTGVGAMTAFVTDVDGAPVPNVYVTFSETGPGRFVNTAGSSFTVQTDAAGKATVEVSSLASETGTETITATINESFNGTTQCTAVTGKDQAGTALTGTRANAKAGNCSDTATVTYAAASPSPTATTPPGGRANLTLHVDTPVIKAGQRGNITVTGTVGQAIQLMCYTRPSTTYFVARETTISTGSVQFALSLGMNTRCYARYTTNNTSGASLSGVINVQTVISIFPVRNSYRNYTFQGHNMPKYAGQLITLYFVNSNGTSTIKGQIHTNTTGIYYIPVKFVSSGTHTFYVRTGQTMTNAAGESAHVAVNIH